MVDKVFITRIKDKIMIISYTPSATKKVLGYPCLVEKNSDDDLLLVGSHGMIYPDGKKYSVIFTSPAVGNKYCKLTGEDKMKQGEEHRCVVSEAEAIKLIKILKVKKKRSAQLEKLTQIMLGHNADDEEEGESDEVQEEEKLTVEQVLAFAKTCTKRSDFTSAGRKTIMFAVKHKIYDQCVSDLVDDREELKAKPKFSLQDFINMAEQCSYDGKKWFKENKGAFLASKRNKEFIAWLAQNNKVVA